MNETDRLKAIEAVELELFKVVQEQEQLYLDFKSLDRKRSQITAKITALRSKVRRLTEPRTKKCCKCRLEMDVDQFYDDTRYADNRYPYCRECVSEDRKRRYQKRKAAA